jgi:D-alanyl-D-alanine carboxypeptidase/D-alanyl-D-alanine-endopeptidase (penicillin-binding protein 4)
MQRSNPPLFHCPTAPKPLSQTIVRSHILRLPACFLIASCLTLGASEEIPPATLVELQTRISNHITQPRFDAALWGVKIVSANSSNVIFEHNPQKLFSPASNSKLYTVALGLDLLGLNHRIKTSVLAASRPDAQGVLNADLIVYGRGDPGINARLHSNDLYRALQPLVAVVTQAGIKRINGDLVGDETFIHGPPFGSGWAWDDAENYYGAEISALTINDNVLQVGVKPGGKPGDPCNTILSPPTSYITLVNETETTTPGGGRPALAFRHPACENTIYISGKVPFDARGSNEEVTVHSPAGLFVWFFREALLKNGITVSGKLRTLSSLDHKPNATEPGKYVELGFIESQPMSDIAAEIMKPSQNLYTDLLLAYVGEQRRSEAPRDQTSEQLGIRELNRFLGEVGVKRGDVLFEEGSGLSRNNLTTPNATITLLQYMNGHKAADTFFKALPVAGVDGTLRSRMKGTPAERNVRAKTGTLRWANSLSGEVTTAAGERLLFCIMLNRYHSSDSNRARSEIDEIPILLASFTGHINGQQH